MPGIDFVAATNLYLNRDMFLSCSSILRDRKAIDLSLQNIFILNLLRKRNIVIKLGSQQHVGCFVERAVLLPSCYMVNDHRQSQMHQASEIFVVGRGNISSDTIDRSNLSEWIQDQDFSDEGSAWFSFDRWHSMPGSHLE